MANSTSRADDKDLPKLKPRTKAFVDLLDSPEGKDLSQTEAYIRTHATDNRNTARTNASQLLATAHVKIYRQKTEQLAKQNIVKLSAISMRKANASPAYARLAADLNNSILDRNLGKPTTYQETKTTSVNLNLDASQELNDAFLAFLKADTRPKGT